MAKTKKWFSKGEKFKSSSAPVDHVQLTYEGWTEHDTEAAAESAAKDAAAAADKAAKDAERAAADKAAEDTSSAPAPTGGQPATSRTGGSKPSGASSN